MNNKRILREGDGKPYTVDHTFNITQGENKISTHVKVSVTSPDPGQSKQIADSQIRKVMAYMRGQDDENEEQFSSGSTTRPLNAEPTQDLPALDHEEQEEENPQSSARDFWKTKGFGESKDIPLNYTAPRKPLLKGPIPKSQRIEDMDLGGYPPNYQTYKKRPHKTFNKVVGKGATAIKPANESGPNLNLLTPKQLDEMVAKAFELAQKKGE